MGTTFKETKIGRIPNDWQVQELAGCLNITNGFPAESEYFTKDDVGIPLIRIRDISGQFTEAQYVGDYPQGCVVKKGDLLVAMDGEFVATQWKGDNALLNQRVCRLETKSPGILNQAYLFYDINIHLRKIEQSTGATTVKHLSTKDINRIRIALPPLAEQRKIAEILSTVDKTIENTAAIIQETQRLKKGLMQKLFTEGIGHTRFKETKIGRMPEEWEVVNLSNVFQVIDGDRGVNYPKSNQMFDDGYCVFLNAKNVTKLGFKFDEVQFITQKKDGILGKGKLTRGDLVLTTRGTLGNFAYFNDEVNFDNLRINSGMVVLRPLNKILTNYYYGYFNSYLMQNQIERLSFGTAQSQLTVGGIQEFRLVVPPNDEQRQIADILSEVDAKIEKEQAFKSELEQLKKGLMQVLLTGEVRVKV